ncbi:NAD(P)H-hydrate dehydratase [Yoonia maritima]|uniref:NAD(P)H-hydrate dehydratase n=1 Tax=Yoonia maritima TaxID=1435347 RepID=UPI003736124A
MTELLTAAQMRAIEAAAIASGEVTGLELMERAGWGVVEAIFEEWPELSPSWGPTPKPPEYLLQDDEKGKHRAVVLCGPGNNGGDGFVVARLLHEAGWGVEVFLYGDAEKLPPDAKVNYERWCEMGGVATFDGGDAHKAIWGADIVLDAIFGTGLTRPIEGELAEAIWAMNADGDLCIEQPSSPRFVSVDVPTGICADSGRFLQAVAPSHLTVTFHKPKVGLYLDWAVALGRKVAVCDIGLKPSFHAFVALELHEQVALSTEPTRRHSSNAYSSGNYLGKGHTRDDPYPRSLHKYSHGHALFLSGGSGKGGATRLAARGALRIGAGAVTVGCPERALIENAAQLNAVMLTVIEDDGSLVSTLEDERINALCIGPGFGLRDREHDLLATVLGEGGTNPRATVLDADALTHLNNDKALFDRLHNRCVLTPHAGEFARLFPDIAEKLDAPATTGPAYSKVDATRDAAKRAGCVVLFKGPDTVIADPSGRCSINASVYERAAPWLATAGSGDVLAGFITGLLARGFAPMQAAETGAWLHTECALKFGPGLIAEDLPEQLPAVFRDLGM